MSATFVFAKIFLAKRVLILRIQASFVSDADGVFPLNSEGIKLLGIMFPVKSLLVADEPYNSVFVNSKLRLASAKIAVLDT